MRSLACRLHQEQTSFGSRWEDASPACVLCQRRVVEYRVESEQRKLKAVLPPLLAVTRALAAAPRGHDRLDLEFKTNGLSTGSASCDDGKQSQTDERRGVAHGEKVRVGAGGFGVTLIVHRSTEDDQVTKPVVATRCVL